MVNSKSDKVIVLGIDGLDPNILEELMGTGHLPGFSSLRKTGTYRRLMTSNPAQSPVVWSSIATGGNPGYHGVFDFIVRNPKNYLPELAIMKINERNLFARRDSMFLPARKGTPFWNFTSRAKIPTTVIRWPMTFPPETISGYMLSGLGVPDIKANLGRYTFYTTHKLPENDQSKGDVIPVPPNAQNFETVITGPRDSHIPIKIVMDDEHSKTILNIDGDIYSIQEGEWSDWVRLRFSIGFRRHISGLCRFYLKSIRPELELYLSPIQVDPREPAFSVSYPDKYAAELAGELGDYHTLGMPEDTNALNDNRFDEEVFLDLCNKIMLEREKMLWYELERFKEGLLAFVFDTTDRIQHIFWSATDPKHPNYNEASASRYQNVIRDYYKRIDKILGRVLQSMDEKTVVIVLSDHGFTSYRRAVHLNSWLVENGFMILDQSPRDEEGGPLFRHVIWERTKAYALGFSSIYLNLRNREGKGIVDSGDEARELKGRIADSLILLKDPKTGGSVISGVYRKGDLYRGPYLGDAPDLIIGFQPGYRASWQTAIGGTPEGILEDNLRKWSGDHLVDPNHVPGILLINRKTAVTSPGVIDIAPTILECFQIPGSHNMEGISLL